MLTCRIYDNVSEATEEDKEGEGEKTAHVDASKGKEKRPTSSEALGRPSPNHAPCILSKP